ncbi:MAG: BamA/TamA family outer membrane protein [FCB group bacterium]|nr:BamA/TamA family outer membrane protein [FCB group bacterium]
MTWFKTVWIIPAIILAFGPLALAEETGLDTTRVREVVKIKKSAAEKIADIPGEIVKFPIRTIRFVSHAIGTNPPVANILDVINFAAPAKKYVPVAGYGKEAGLKFGFGLRKLNLPINDRVRIDWYYSTNDYQSYRVRYRIEKFFSDRLGIDFYFRYKKRTRESFYGLGMDSRKDYRANFTHEHTEFRLDIPVQTAGNIFLGFSGGYIISNLYDGRDPELEGHLAVIAADPDFALTEGRLDGSRYILCGGVFRFDGRDHAGQPSRGTLIKSRMVRYLGVNRSDNLGFYHTRIDVSHYIEVFKKRILAARIVLQRFDADNNNDRALPINLTGQLGGIDGLRGYARGRFIDNDLALASLEWRFPVWRILDGFVFLDEGRVYDEITDSQFFSNWQYSAGFGFRVWNARDVSLMMLAAKSDEEMRFYLEAGASW